MKKAVQRLRVVVLISSLGMAHGVSCTEATFREAQFGLLDGINEFFSQSLIAVLTELVPFLRSA